MSSLSGKPSNVNVLVPSPSDGSQTNNLRSSSPEFPCRPSPDIPPWLSKCLKVLTMSNEEAQEELGRMLDEAVERRDRQGQKESIPTGPGVSVIRKTEGRPGVLIMPKVAPLPIKSITLKSKLSTDSTRSSALSLKRVRTASPPLVHMGSPEYAGTTVTIPDDISLYQMDEGVSVGFPGTYETDYIDLDFPEYACCVVCRKTTEPNGNRLLTCISCSKQYHQLCHTPTVTDVDASDPRFVWYCCDCGSKTVKPAESPITSRTLPSSSTAKSKASVAKSAVSPPPPTSSLFQRSSFVSNSKVSAVSVSSSNSTGGGLAGLAKLKTLGQPVAVTKSDKPVPKRARYIDQSKLPSGSHKNN